SCYVGMGLDAFLGHLAAAARTVPAVLFLEVVRRWGLGTTRKTGGCISCLSRRWVWGGGSVGTSTLTIERTHQRRARPERLAKGELLDAPHVEPARVAELQERRHQLQSHVGDVVRELATAAASGGVRDDSHAKRFEADERELVGDRRQLGVTVGGAATEGRHEVVAVVPGSGQLRLDSQAALRVAAGPVVGIADA